MQPQVFYGMHQQQPPVMMMSPPRATSGQRDASPFGAKSPIQAALEMRYLHP
jgi:hypothetical protein